MLFANYIHWQGNYDKALKQAHSEQKPLLVLVVKRDDIQIHNILKTTLMNQPYIDTMNEKMIAVMVTYEGRSSYPVEMYYTTVFPAMFFVNTQTETFIAEPLYGDTIKADSLLKIINRLQ
jgi:uncharacterized protein YyaL (SSP411 family)